MNPMFVITNFEVSVLLVTAWGYRVRGEKGGKIRTLGAVNKDW